MPLSRQTDRSPHSSHQSSFLEMCFGKEPLNSTLTRVALRIPRMGSGAQTEGLVSKCTAEQLLALSVRSVIWARYATSRAVASFRGCGTAGLSPSSPRGWQCHSGFLTAQIYQVLRVSESCLCINRTCVDLQA